MKMTFLHHGMGVGWVCDVCVNPISLQWSLNVSRTRMYCYSSINLSQLLAAWAQRLPTLLKLAIGLAGYRVEGAHSYIMGGPLSLS